MWSDWWVAHRAEVYAELVLFGIAALAGAFWTLVIWWRHHRDSGGGK